MAKKTQYALYGTATMAGTADGWEWAREQELADLERSLQPGQFDADEELLNALGRELAGKYLGGLSAEHLTAYNRAHTLAVIAEIQHRELAESNAQAPSVAQQRAARFDDGSTLTEPQREAFVEGVEVSRVDGTETRFAYVDGSAIVTSGGAWDVAGPCGRHWAGQCRCDA
jgi:hypothetical protein